MSDVTTSVETAPGWTRLKFHVIGWIYCLVTGNLWKYDFLRAQAYLETNNLSSRLFADHRNAWGMTYPTPYTNGTTIGADGVMGSYSSWWNAWKGRLKWDERHGVAKRYATYSEYCKALQQAGFNRRPGYCKAIEDEFRSFSWFGQFANNGWDGEHSLWQNLKKLLRLLLVLGLTLTAIYIVWKLAKRNRK